MTTKTHKIRVGLFVTITAALVAVVLFVFGGLRFWEHKAHYTIQFDDSVMGLETGAQVYLDGIKVGRVDKIEVAPNDLRKVQISITVAADAPIHTDTVAMLQYAGITGLKVIDLREGSLATPRLADGGQIKQGETTLDKMSRQAVQIADQSEQMMKRASQIVDNLVAITDPKRFADMDAILAKGRETAANLAQASGTLRSMVAENRIALRDTLASVHTLVDTGMSGLIGNAGELIADLKTLVTGSEGQVRSAVYDLRQASRNFKELSRDVRQRPSRLLFSSAPSERKLP